MKRLFPSSRQTFKACRGLAQVFHHISPVVLYVEETFICFVRLLRPRDTRSGISPVKEVDWSCPFPRGFRPTHYTSQRSSAQDAARSAGKQTNHTVSSIHSNPQNP
jgi:hypothetical protein